jgi:hypothetical protein
MKQLILLALMTLAASTAAGQMVTDSPIIPSSSSPQQIIVPEFVESLAPQAASRVTIRYYDPKAEVRSIGVPIQVGDRSILGLSQRYTLPVTSGFLDSIQIHFDSSDGKSIFLGITTDLIGNNWSTGKPFHYSYNTYHVAEMNMAGFEKLKNFTIKIPVGHVPVPKEFHIVLRTPQAGFADDTGTFALYGQVHVGRAPLFDSARSGYYFRDTKDKMWSDVLDGLFQVDGQPLGIDFRMSAIVDISTASVTLTGTSESTVYPNPAQHSGLVHVSHSETISSISIRDMLGNEVFKSAGSAADIDLSRSSLAPGVYNVVITSDAGVSSEKLVIQ